MDGCLTETSGPFHKLQVEHNNRIDHRNEQKGYKSCCREASDLCITHRFPKGTTVYRQREESDDSRAHCDKNGAKPHDTGVQHCLLERFSFSVPFLDEIEKDDDVADDDADETHHTQETHETERSAHNPQCCQGSDGSVRNCRKNNEGFDGVLELEHQREEDAHNGD